MIVVANEHVDFSGDETVHHRFQFVRIICPWPNSTRRADKGPRIWSRIFSMDWTRLCKK